MGAVIFDPNSYAIIADGFNGPPRKGGELCGGDVCNRDSMVISSGTRCEIGCHHAEFNAICNASRLGHSTEGKHMAISCAPCLMCAKMLHHSGIVRVYFVNRLNYSLNGVENLSKYIDVQQIHEYSAPNITKAPVSTPTAP